MTGRMTGGRIRGKSRRLCMMLSLVLAFCLTGCAQEAADRPTVKAAAVDLMADVTAQPVQETALTPDFVSSQFSYSVNVLKQAAAQNGEENLMVSPLSMELALAMAANGAKGETLTQLLDVFGASSPEELNRDLHSYTAALGEDCRISNSIWYRRLVMEPDRAFLQVNADYYGAEIYEAPFDETTVTDVNAWVQHSTDGMIRKIMDRVDPLDRMYLLNAVCFDAKWQDAYKDTDVHRETFYAYDGTEQAADMMIATERQYFSDDHAQGFVKDYEDGRYRFAAIRPNDGVDLFDYLEELTGEHLQRMLSDRKTETVRTRIPQFSSESELNMKDVLQMLGVSEAFNNHADFSGMGQSPDGLRISGIMQKTFIEVTPEGTRAAAVTGVTMAGKSMTPEEVHTVYLDRPFLYMILDGETGLPVFMGIVTSLEE